MDSRAVVRGRSGRGERRCRLARLRPGARAGGEGPLYLAFALSVLILSVGAAPLGTAALMGSSAWMEDVEVRQQVLRVFGGLLLLIGLVRLCSVSAG